MNIIFGNEELDAMYPNLLSGSTSTLLIGPAGCGKSAILANIFTVNKKNNSVVCFSPDLTIAKPGSILVKNCLLSLREIEKKHRQIKLILIDNLEQFTPLANYSSEQERVEFVAREFITHMPIDAVLVCSAQSSLLPDSVTNNPDFLLSRRNLPEKALIRTFSNVITVTQTPQEAEQKSVRLFIDKSRLNRTSFPNGYKPVFSYQLNP